VNKEIAVSQQHSASSDGTFLRFFRFLVRFLFVIVVGVLLAVALYYGAPWLYRNLVQPIQENSVRLTSLEKQVDREHERLREENKALEERVAALESELAQLQEDVSVEIQDRETLEEEHRELKSRVAQAEDDLMAQQQAIEATRDEMNQAFSSLEGDVLSLEERLGDVQMETDSLAGRLVLLQAAQDLLKVRFFLFEENEQAAREAVALTVTHLDQAIGHLPAQAETLEGLRERVADLDELIARRSFRVRPDLEALWADIMELVVPPSLEEPTPAQSPLPTPTPAS
jgi:chromosome segregation ATPase